MHRLLGLSERCRTVELKQACYSGTAAVQLAVQYVARHPEKKALVIAADIARYDLNSGRSNAGMWRSCVVITANPRMVCLKRIRILHGRCYGLRPNYRSEALVDGKYST